MTSMTNTNYEAEHTELYLRCKFSQSFGAHILSKRKTRIFVKLFLKLTNTINAYIFLQAAMSWSKAKGKKNLYYILNMLILTKKKFIYHITYNKMRIL